jgi:hypothetical protein
MSKYQVDDEVVFLTDSYNKGKRFRITNVFFQMTDPLDHNKDKYSYRIVNDTTVLWRDEEDLYWIPSDVIDRPKED